MATNVEARRRAVNLESVPEADLERIAEELGKKIGEILDRADKEANRLAQVYGLEVKIAAQFINKATGEGMDAPPQA